MPKVTISKKTPGLKTAAKAKAGAVVDFQILDTQDAKFTVLGVDAAGATVDISSLAVIDKLDSNNHPVLTVDPPKGMVSTMHAAGPGNAEVSVTVSFNDGAIGPFTFVLPVTVGGSAISGLTLDIGTPTVRP